MEQYTNNPVETVRSEEAVGTAMRPPLSDDHGRLKARLRPMRGLKQLRSVRVISVGHAFIQNVRGGLLIERLHAAGAPKIEFELAWRTYVPPY